VTALNPFECEFYDTSNCIQISELIGQLSDSASSDVSQSKVSRLFSNNDAFIYRLYTILFSENQTLQNHLLGELDATFDVQMFC